MTTKIYHPIAGVAIALVGCMSSPRVSAVRFANAPVTEVVDDRRDVPTPPKRQDTWRTLYQFDRSFMRLMTRPLELTPIGRARGVNALDEVPDSTWFTNRIGVRELSLDELRVGPEVKGSPEPHMPWLVIRGKPKGVAVGFTISDARGERYLLKLEPAGIPEAESAADVIVNRLLWACGYNVPEDHVVYFSPSDLRVDANATMKDAVGKTVRLERAEVDRWLATADIGADGRFRALASRIIDGTALGGRSAEGVRADDPNDRIPHELRRDVRGAYAIHAWLDNPDIKEDNTVDVWIADPANPAHHYVKHYLVDFGKGLGVMATTSHDLRPGYVYSIDFRDITATLVTVGLVPRPWERRAGVALRGVGLYEARYDPGAWRPFTPVDLPTRVADRIDNFWGSKILIRFTREQLRAVVETARLTDPLAVEYLVDTLVARQRVTAQYWFARVNPLDQFEVVATPRGPALCFDDLALAHGLAAAVHTRYVVTTHDRDGRPLGGRHGVRAVSPRTCSAPLVLAHSPDAYTMVRVDTSRPGFVADITPGTIIHIALDPDTYTPRVVGVWRL